MSAIFTCAGHAATRYTQVLTYQNLLSRARKMLITLAIRTPSHLKEFSHAHNPLYASRSMSKLDVAGQENIDDVSYSHAHTCTVQGHRKEFSHAHTYAKWRQPLLLPRQTECQEFCHVHTCNPPPPARRNSRKNDDVSISHVHTWVTLRS